MVLRWRRILLRGFLAVAALSAAAVAVFPWWWPAVAARVDGVSIGEWHTQGWSTVELRDVAYEREGLRVTAARLKVPAFGRWPRPENGPAFLARQVVITPIPVDRPDAPPPSAQQVAADVLRAWPTVQDWLPSADVENIEIAIDPSPVQIARVRWAEGRAVVVGTIPGRDESMTLTLARTEEDTLHVTAAVPDWTAQVEATARTVEERLDIDATLIWREQSASVSAQFGAEGLVPTSAALGAPSVEIPAAELGLAGYGPVHGAVRGEWTGSEFTASVSAQAQPAAEDGGLPPLAVDLRASGDPRTVRIDSALVNVPGVEATLSAPLALTLATGMPAEPAEFALAVDLARVPRSFAQGTVNGRVSVSASPAAVEFSLAGEAVRWRDAEIRSIDVAGSWEPGRLLLDRWEMRLAGDAYVQANADVDLAAEPRLTFAAVTANLSSAALRPWIPELPEFSELLIEGSAVGPLARPDHEGTVRWSGLGGLPGGALGGEATWKGAGVETLTLRGEARSAAEVTVPFAGALQRTEDGTLTAEVTELAWQDAHGAWWRLTQTAGLRVGEGGIEVDDLRLAGEEIALNLAASVRWPGSGRVTIEAHEIAGSRLSAFLPALAAAAQLETLTLEALWDDGPVRIEGVARATYAPDPAAVYTVATEFRTQDDRLALGALQVLDASGAVLQGEGRMPFTLEGRADGFRVAFPADGELALKLASTPNNEFWESITRLTGWELNWPEVAVELSGTLAAPRGRIELTTTAVQAPPGVAGTVQLPRIGDVKLVVVADDDGLTLTQGILTLNHNWVSLRGSAPWSLWREAREKKTVPWRSAAFAFAADRMPMTIASNALPTLFSPEGDVSFSVRHTPDRGFEGFLVLADAAMRPLPPLGVVRDIGGRIEVDGYALRLPELGALVGGRPISITGEADITRADQPVFDVRLVSARVPLVRQQGLVLRAGLDLRVAQNDEKPAHIAGTIELGQSVFLSDIVSLLPTGGSVATPEQRPPYFSVDGQPFADWTLDVKVHGDDFLRIENPFFTGTVAADFHLDGTLGEPRAIGRAWSDSGTIIFPFGRLRVEQVEVSLTEQNPYTPTIFANAATRIYGYDVRLEITGSAADPRLQFSSDPPLSSQAVFLMLSTGEMPDATNGFSTSERARRLAFFVGRNLANSLGIGGGVNGEDRLIVRSGEDFSREGGETIYVQYNLDGRWSLVAEKDRFDAYNGGIKFRVIER